MAKKIILSSLQPCRQQAGRKPSRFLDIYFKRGDLKPDNSNRRFYYCTFCDAEILQREITCAQHILSVEKCPDASAEARAWALKEISGKKKVSADVEEVKGPRSSLEKPAPKKQKTAVDQKVTTFLERELDETTKNSLDVRLLRSVKCYFKQQ